MRTLATTATVLLVLVSGCQSKDDTASAKANTTPEATNATTSGTPSSPATPASAPAGTEAPTGSPGDVSGIPDPCDLLTSDIAGGALGVEVGPSTTTPGENNSTCSYAPADGRANVFVLLTTYAASGEAALKDATKAFPDARPVPGLGDSAYVSPSGHAIGVSAGDLLFGMSLLTPTGLEQSPEVTVHELVAVAQAVLQDR